MSAGTTSFLFVRGHIAGAAVEFNHLPGIQLSKKAFFLKKSPIACHKWSTAIWPDQRKNACYQAANPPYSFVSAIAGNQGFDRHT
jgi:hypothetical protein